MNKLVFIGFLCVSVTGYTQQIIRGKVVDAETGAALSYAHLSIGNTGIGSATSEDGYFQMNLPKLQNEYIKVSYLGYANRFFSLDSLLKTGTQEFSFSLQPQPLVLDDIQVHERKITPGEMVKQAIQAVPKNYYQQPFNMEFYSHISVRDSVKEVYLLETVAETYRKGYVAGQFNATRITQKRETGKDPLPKLTSQKSGNTFSQYYPGFDIFFADMPGTGKGYSVFNVSLHKRMAFAYVGVSVFDQDTVCIIEYSTRKKNLNEKEDLEGKYSGVIYIAANNLAVIRHTIRLNNTQTEIIYKRTENGYFPYLIKSIRPKKAENKVFIVTHEAIQTRLITDPVTAFEIMPDELDTIPYNQDFWQQYRKEHKK
ncbi:MAG: carboxypeptidase-like regulatory domain-containing protein [Cyclobacteriaceae bacterium]|nr:carboxypeptidase-like regulatory domain-containing protein [Cyclobacteriaceae bacterium]